MEKLKAGIFDGYQIRELMKDPVFDETRSKAELSAWQSLKSVVTNFQGKSPERGIQERNSRATEEFLPTQTRLSVKLHFLQLHLDHFPENCRGIHVMEEHH